MYFLNKRDNCIVVIVIMINSKTLWRIFTRQCFQINSSECLSLSEKNYFNERCHHVIESCQLNRFYCKKPSFTQLTELYSFLWRVTSIVTSCFIESSTNVSFWELLSYSFHIFNYQINVKYLLVLKWNYQEKRLISSFLLSFRNKCIFNHFTGH